MTGIIPRELRLPPNFPAHCMSCIHYARQIKHNDKFINGHFCARIADWPPGYREDAGLLDPCNAYRKRDPSVVTYLRECAPFVIDMDHFF